MKPQYLLPLSAALCSLFTTPDLLHAQGTAFGYQGRLSSGTNAANGSYDLTFAIFNALSGAGKVGATLSYLSIKAGTGNEPITITRPLKLRAPLGPVTIGAP